MRAVQRIPPDCCLHILRYLFDNFNPMLMVIN